jgi:hypothetical protein
MPPQSAVMAASTTDSPLWIDAEFTRFDYKPAGPVRGTASVAGRNGALSMLRCDPLARRRSRTPAAVHSVAVKIPAQSAHSQKNFCGKERTGNPLLSLSSNESAIIPNSRRYSEPSRR